MYGTNEIERGLWAAFGVLFAVLAGAMFLPVRPIVWVVPLWLVPVIVAMVATTGIAAVAVVAYDWPEGSR